VTERLTCSLTKLSSHLFSCLYVYLLLLLLFIGGLPFSVENECDDQHSLIVAPLRVLRDKGEVVRSGQKHTLAKRKKKD
jgi:hypothetical protein